MNSQKFVSRIVYSLGSNALESRARDPLLDRPALHIVVLDNYSLGSIPSGPARPTGHSTTSRVWWVLSPHICGDPAPPATTVSLNCKESVGSPLLGEYGYVAAQMQPILS
jgi:hypothetical protein